jgi:5'-AMP-activated protein kinase regulatory beta subunit
MARKTKGKKTARKRVKFTTEAKDGSKVFVAGTFNEWNPTKNQLRMKDGVYTTSLLVPSGRHEYKFIIDGTWCLDPKCQEWTPNDMGSLNSVLIVG